MLLFPDPQSRPMPPRDKVDRATRERLRAWLKYFYRRSGEPSEASFARWLGTSQPTVHQILSGEKTMGLDVLLKMSTKCRKSLDELADTWPPGTPEDSSGGRGRAMS